MTALLIMAVLVLLVCAGMLVYFHSLQSRYYELAAAAVGKVEEIRIVESSTFVWPGGALDDDGGDRGAAKEAAGEIPGTTPAVLEPLAIEGSKVIAVGRRSAEFTVVEGLPSASGDATAGSRVHWRVEPPNAASGAAADPTGRSAAFYPAFPGAFTVLARVTDASGRVTHEGRFETAAVEAPQTAALELPWVGQGVGTLVVIVLLLGIVLYLAYEGVLDGAVVATLLTAVAGFAFGLRAAAPSVK